MPGTRRLCRHQHRSSHTPAAMSAPPSANHQNPAGSTSARMMSTPVTMHATPIQKQIPRRRNIKHRPPLAGYPYRICGGRHICALFFLFPITDLCRERIQARIALVALGRDLARLHGGEHRAARLFQVRAVTKAALADIWTEFPECIL